MKLLVLALSSVAFNSNFLCISRSPFSWYFSESFRLVEIPTPSSRELTLRYGLTPIFLCVCNMDSPLWLLEVSYSQLERQLHSLMNSISNMSPTLGTPRQAAVCQSNNKFWAMF